jgi:hypothetical protein
MVPVDMTRSHLSRGLRLTHRDRDIVFLLDLDAIPWLNFHGISWQPGPRQDLFGRLGFPAKSSVREV